MRVKVLGGVPTKLVILYLGHELVVGVVGEVAGRRARDARARDDQRGVGVHAHGLRAADGAVAGEVGLPRARVAGDVRAALRAAASAGFESGTRDEVGARGQRALLGLELGCVVRGCCYYATCTCKDGQACVQFLFLCRDRYALDEWLLFYFFGAWRLSFQFIRVDCCLVIFRNREPRGIYVQWSERREIHIISHSKKFSFPSRPQTRKAIMKCQKHAQRKEVRVSLDPSKSALEKGLAVSNHACLLRT